MGSGIFPEQIAQMFEVARRKARFKNYRRSSSPWRMHCSMATHSTSSSRVSGNKRPLLIPKKPIDVLAQQIVACAAAEDWSEEKLFSLVRGAYPYRDLSREEFSEVMHGS